MTQFIQCCYGSCQARHSPGTEHIEHVPFTQGWELTSVGWFCPQHRTDHHPSGCNCAFHGVPNRGGGIGEPEPEEIEHERAIAQLKSEVDNLTKRLAEREEEYVTWRRKGEQQIRDYRGENLRLLESGAIAGGAIAELREEKLRLEETLRTHFEITSRLENEACGYALALGQREEQLKAEVIRRINTEIWAESRAVDLANAKTEEIEHDLALARATQRGLEQQAAEANRLRGIAETELKAAKERVAEVLETEQTLRELIVTDVPADRKVSESPIEVRRSALLDFAKHARLALEITKKLGDVSQHRRLQADVWAEAVALAEVLAEGEL